PENFGTVVEGSIYRSNYPQEDNFPYLQSLGLRSILTLVTTESPAYDQFIAENGIQQFRVHLPANKDKIKVTDEDMARALEFVLDRENHPILIHCNKGKHRTGCVVGCFRRVVGATTKEDIFREYHKYAGRKARIWDEAFIEKYDTAYSFFAAVANKWIAPPRPPSP
ncbi:protein-tyrosine phosphatase, partial [Westerdykella ornata]